MKEFLLNKKWVGAVALFLYVAAVSTFFTGLTVKYIKQAAPTVERELVDFMPIRFENGMIVEPEDTIITKSYNYGNVEHKIVLDTRVDELENSELKVKGLYVSRKFVYFVSDLKTEVRSLKNQPDMVIDEEMVRNTMDDIQNKSGKYIFLILLIAFWIFTAAAIGLYTLAMHWAFAKMFHNSFSQTLRINTFAYVAVSAIIVVFGFNIGIIGTFVILGAVNYAVNKWLQEEQKSDK